MDQNLDIDPEQLLQFKQEVTIQELAELLGVQFEDTSVSSADECCCSGPDQKLHPEVYNLIQKSVSQHLPEPPADVEQNLQEHLMNLKNSVLSELLRLSPQLEPLLMGCLVDWYHGQTCAYLHLLLQNICSPINCLALLQWGLKTYLRYLSACRIEEPSLLYHYCTLLARDVKLFSSHVGFSGTSPVRSSLVILNFNKWTS